MNRARTPAGISRDGLHLRGDHPGFAGVVEDAAGVDDRADFAKRLERVGGAVHGQRVVVKIERREVAGSR